MAKIVLQKVVNELELVKVVVTSRYSVKLFGGHKPCYDSQWPLTGCYFKGCKYLINTHKYLEASYELKRARTISLSVLKNVLKEIFLGKMTVKGNTMPIFNSDMTVLLKLCFVSLIFLCFSIKKIVQSRLYCQ